jgi:hypothetical protein
LNVGLSRLPDGTAPGCARVAGPALEGFEQFSFASGRDVHPVYYAGDPLDPPLLLLPELAGFSPGLRMFAERLIAARFRVYMPWLFGPFGRRAPLRNGIRLCVSREFAYLPLIIDPRVAAAVAAQPAAPLWPPSGQLNVSDGEIAAARARLAGGEAHLLAVRCRPDRVCPRAKIERLQREFPVGLEVREYGEPDERNGLGERPHATFTREYRIAPDASAEHYSRRAFADLVAFFEKHLRVSMAPPSCP